MRKKGHEVLAQQLVKIIDNKVSVSQRSLEMVPRNKQSNLGDKRALVSLPTDRRYNQPLATLIERSNLEHHMVLPADIEDRFPVIEKEYTARERLARYGFKHRKKILLYGSPGCGKTLGAQRIAWFIKVTIITYLYP